MNSDFAHQIAEIANGLQAIATNLNVGAQESLAGARAQLAAFGVRMRTVRTQAGLSLDELGAHVNIDKPTLSRIERGQFMPTAEQAALIREWLDTITKEMNHS